MRGPPAGRPPVTEGWAGVAASPLFLVAFALFAGPPSPREAAEALVPYLTDHRAQVFASAVLIGFGSCLYAWYLAGLRRFVDPSDDASLGTASMLCGLLAVAVVVAALAVLAGVVLHVPEQPLALVAYDAFNGLVTVGGFGFGASVVCAAVAGDRRGTLAPGLARAGIAIGLLQLATVPGLWTDAGPFAPLGAVAVAAFFLLTAWYAAVAVAMTRCRGASPTPV